MALYTLDICTIRITDAQFDFFFKPELFFANIIIRFPFMCLYSPDIQQPE